MDKEKELMENQDRPTMEQKEFIKLTRNSKGYCWELKILSLDINKLDELNTEMIKNYGVVKK